MKDIIRYVRQRGMLILLMLCVTGIGGERQAMAAEMDYSTPTPEVTAKPTIEPTTAPTMQPTAEPTTEPLAKPMAPELTAVTPSEKGIYVTFSKVEEVDGYQVYVRESGSAAIFEEVERVYAAQYEEKMAQGGVFVDVEEFDIYLGKSYEIMVRSYVRRPMEMNNGWWIVTTYEDVYSEDSNVMCADMPQVMVEEVSVKALSESQTKITWEKVSGVHGYEIQYAVTEHGPFQTAIVLTGDSVTSWQHNNLEIGTTYYYKVYAVGAVTKSYDATVVKCLVTFAKPQSVKSKMMGPKKMQLTWKKVNGAQGYIIYRSATKSSWSKGTYKKYKTLKGVNKTSLKVPKVTNGTCYHYKIMAYTVKAGVTIEGNAAKHSRYADYYGYENESYSSKWKRIYGKRNKEYNYRTSGKYMKTIRVKVWDFASGQSGRKVTKIKTIRVHKNIAPTVKKIFQEIYKGKEKAPIYEAGGYSPRTGQHGQGLALDLNSNYNYMIDGGKVLAGSCWKPKKYAYSIKRNGDIEKAFRKYGFPRGFWGERKDYMHFSYFGV